MLTVVTPAALHDRCVTKVGRNCVSVNCEFRVLFLFETQVVPE
jgi:hypothetical protein